MSALLLESFLFSTPDDDELGRPNTPDSDEDLEMDGDEVDDD